MSAKQHKVRALRKLERKTAVGVLVCIAWLMWGVYWIRGVQDVSAVAWWQFALALLVPFVLAFVPFTLLWAINDKLYDLGVKRRLKNYFMLTLPVALIVVLWVYNKDPYEQPEWLIYPVVYVALLAVCALLWKLIDSLRFDQQFDLLVVSLLTHPKTYKKMEPHMYSTFSSWAPYKQAKVGVRQLPFIVLAIAGAVMLPLSFDRSSIVLLVLGVVLLLFGIAKLLPKGITKN